jgi:alpha-1,2-mannosyltransferase
MNLPRSRPGPGRRAVASLWASIALPYLAVALCVPLARALGVYGRVSVPALVLLSVLAGPALVALVPRLASPLPESLDDWLEPGHRWLASLWGAGGLVALGALGRNAVFLGDPSRTGYSVMPADAFLVRHSCLTAYMHGALLSRSATANVYEMAFVDTAREVPLPPSAAHFAPFTLDAFGYPPPFLLLPRALLALTTDFLSQRVLFSAGSLLLLLLACALTARTLGGAAERRLWLLTPVFLGNLVVVITLQVGNFHLAALALCLLCWVALERRKDEVAGALLAVATLAKIFPGLLGVLLLVQRRWRAAGLTALVAAALCALSVGVLGAEVWRDFLFYHLPRVQSGEALRFMAETVREVSFNLAPFGLPFKLGALGFEGWGWPQARLFGSVYTAVLFVLAVLAGRNQGSAPHRLTVWLSMLMLASLRSPYAAPFVLVTLVVWLLVLATELRSRRGVAGFVLLWALCLLPAPLTQPHLIVAVSLVRVLFLYVVLLWGVLRREKVTP